MDCKEKDFCIYIQEEKNKVLSEEINLIKKDLIKIIDFIESNNNKNLENIESINDILESEEESINDIKFKLESIYKVISNQNNESENLKSSLAQNYENLLLENEKLKKDEVSGFFNISYLYNILENIENIENKNIFIIELKDFLDMNKSYDEKDIDNILRVFFLLIERNFSKEGNQIFRINKEKILIIYKEDILNIKKIINYLEENLSKKTYVPKYSKNKENIKIKFNKYFIEIKEKKSKQIKEEINSIL